VGEEGALRVRHNSVEVGATRGRTYQPREKPALPQLGSRPQRRWDHKMNLGHGVLCIPKAGL
jgi:hypothetical protein